VGGQKKKKNNVGIFRRRKKVANKWGKKGVKKNGRMSLKKELRPSNEEQGKHGRKGALTV